MTCSNWFYLGIKRGGDKKWDPIDGLQRIIDVEWLSIWFNWNDQNCNGPHLLQIFFAKPSSQAAENGFCRGEYFDQIGETWITAQDDFEAVLLEERMCALLNDSTYKLIALPAAASQAGQWQNNERLPAENDDNYNVNIVYDSKSTSLPRLSIE